LHEHASLPGLRPAGLPLPGRAVLDQLLRSPRHLAVRRRVELRRSAVRRSARSAVAVTGALLRPGPRGGAGSGHEPVARGAGRLVELVARLPDAEAPPALSRRGGRPRALRQAAGRDYETWRRTPLAALEESGQQEMLNWMCLAGAMSELGRKPDAA